jgi:hypothetical protein
MRTMPMAAPAVHFYAGSQAVPLPSRFYNADECAKGAGLTAMFVHPSRRSHICPTISAITAC